MIAATTIYLVRHAHAVWSDDDARPLSSGGRAMAQGVADQLAPRPIAAVYSSPSRRSIETIEPLATRLGVHPDVVPDLRERELPVVPLREFDELVRQAWASPDEAPGGGESNARARIRALGVLRAAAVRHAGSQVVLATHGNLLAITLHAFDPRLGYAFWRGLSFPDIYQLTFDGLEFQGVTRLWNSNTSLT